MQHDEISNWFVLTLSAEQAAQETDYEHLDALLNRRTEILEKWESNGFQIPTQDLPKLQHAEQRLLNALESMKVSIGGELRSLHRQRKVAGNYRVAA